MTLLRLAFERWLARPLGKYCGLSTKQPSKPERIFTDTPRVHRVLLRAHRTGGTRCPTGPPLVALADKAGCDTRQVERWYRRKRLQFIPTKLTKFQESAWRWVFYCSASTFGLYHLWDKPWLWKAGGNLFLICTVL
jgi:hypothetical protein